MLVLRPEQLNSVELWTIGDVEESHQVIRCNIVSYNICSVYRRIVAYKGIWFAHIFLVYLL